MGRQRRQFYTADCQSKYTELFSYYLKIIILCLLSTFKGECNFKVLVLTSPAKEGTSKTPSSVI